MTFVLLYHDLAEATTRDLVGFPGALAARYKLDPAVFEAHLDAIAATGVEVGTLDARGGFPEAALTFDDGGASAPVAAAALEARGWRGHFFVPTGCIGKHGFLSADGVRELAERGHVVGSHSHTHPSYMGRLSRSQIDEEWCRSRAILAEVLGEEPTTASVPGGSLSKAVVEGAAGAGYRILMTSEPISRVESDKGLMTIGRYCIWSTTSAVRAAAYVRGAWGARAQLWLEWNTKGLAKRLAPAVYERLRRVRARRS